MSAKRTFFYRKSFAEMQNYSIWTRSYRRSSIRRHKRVNLWEGCFRATLFLFSVLPPLSRRNDFWGRSLRLLYGGGRSALSRGAPVGRFMGCAVSFNYSLLSTHYSLFPISSAQYGWLRRCVRQSGHAGLAQSPSISRAKRKQTYCHQHEYAPR